LRLEKLFCFVSAFWVLTFFDVRVFFEFLEDFINEFVWFYFMRRLVKRIELRVDVDIYDKIEKYRIENGFEDRQDAIRDILGKRFDEKDKSFFDWIKGLFGS